MKNNPQYASTDGGERIDHAARAVCRSRNFAGCDKHCTHGCMCDEETLVSNGSWDTALATVAAIDRYDNLKN